MNAYKQDWLRTRIATWVKSHLRPTVQHYTFSNDDEFMRSVIVISTFFLLWLIRVYIRDARAQLRRRQSGSH